MNDFPIPESIVMYLDPAMREMVDHTLEIYEDQKGLKWEDLPEIQRSYGAATKIQNDFFIMMHGLWQEIWGKAIGNRLQSISLDELSEDYPTLESCWYSEMIWNCHCVGDVNIFTAISIDFEEREAKIKLLIYTSEELSLKQLGLNNGDWLEYDEDNDVEADFICDTSFCIGNENSKTFNNIDKLRTIAQAAIDNITRNLAKQAA